MTSRKKENFRGISKVKPEGKFQRMDLSIALIIWLVIVILVYLIARMNSRTVWSSLVLALLIAGIVLAIIRPVTVTEMVVNGSNLASTLYWLIMFLTPLIIIIYVITKAVTDVEHKDVKQVTTRVETVHPKVGVYGV